MLSRRFGYVITMLIAAWIRRNCLRSERAAFFGATFNANTIKIIWCCNAVILAV